MDESKIALIYHSADVDGLASGSIMEYVFRNLSNFGNKIKYDLIGYNYGTDTKENPWLINKNYTEYYFVDCTPPIGWVEMNIENLESGKIRINVFDHHKPKMDNFVAADYAKYMNYYYNDKMCGCLIFLETFQEFFMKVHDIDLTILKNDLIKNQIYEKFTIISSYDTWEFNSWPEKKKKLGCIGFMEYLNMYTHNLKTFYEALFNTPLNTIYSSGMLLAEYKLGIAKRIVSDGFYSEKEKLFILNNSVSWFNTQLIIDKYPDCEKIIYFQIKLDKNQLFSKLSCRTCVQNSFDCVDYLKKICDLNSGGHINAAGGGMTLPMFNRYLNLVKFGNSEY